MPRLSKINPTPRKSYKAMSKDALESVRDAIESRHGNAEEYFGESNWNPAAHVEVTLTVDDVRKVYSALRVLSKLYLS